MNATRCCVALRVFEYLSIATVHFECVCKWACASVGSRFCCSRCICRIQKHLKFKTHKQQQRARIIYTPHATVGGGKERGMVGHSVAQQPQPVSGIATKLSRLPDFSSCLRKPVKSSVGNVLFLLEYIKEAEKKSAGKRHEIEREREKCVRHVASQTDFL